MGRTVAVEDISRTSARDGPREKLSHVVSEESRDRTISPDRVSRDHDAVLTKPPRARPDCHARGMGEYFVEVSSPAVQSSGPGTEGNRQAPPRSGVGGDRLQLAASGSIVQASDGTDPSATWERGFLAVMASSP